MKDEQKEESIERYEDCIVLSMKRGKEKWRRRMLDMLLYFPRVFSSPDLS